MTPETSRRHGGTPFGAVRMRECDCPDWVIRCAHWDGRKLWLVTAAPEGQCCEPGEGVVVKKYAVVDAAETGPCPFTGAPMRHVYASGRYYAGDDLSAAEAAFYAAHES